MAIDIEKEEEASRLRGSLLEFTRYFYEYITGREFIISQPVGRESHHIEVCRALTKVKHLEILREIINIPPGSGKSCMVSMFVAWCWAEFPDANFLYISYGQELAVKHTAFIRSIVSSRMYGYLFDVHIHPDSRAKESFRTIQGGSIKAFGSAGAITGQDAGLPGENRFSGAVLIDDAHKPDEANSDTTRQSVIDNYDQTIRQRVRGMNVPIIYIGQRVHEADLTDYLLSGKDVDEWHPTILKGLDDVGNALYPEMMSAEKLRALQEKSPYVFASQYQQDPLPAGGGLFKPGWFPLLDEDPEILMTFITADTAETTKTWNDATVFSFWGIYEIETMGRKTGVLGLHWLDCVELRIEPKDLESSFMDFYANCCRHPLPPLISYIEKKSSGITLVSILSNLRGMVIREVERSGGSKCKGDRFVEMQPHIASKRVSLPEHGKHTQLCLTHMSRITANNSHRWDDVCYVRDTKIATVNGNVNVQDIKIGDKVITPFGIGTVKCAGSTGFRPVINNINLEGTQNHPVFYGNKFIPLMDVTDMIMLDKLSFVGLLKWKQRQLFYLMEKNLDLRSRQDISKVAEENIKINFFTVLYGNFITNRQYQKAMWFIIRTIINWIIVLKIWSVYRLKNTVLSISREKRLISLAKKFWKECARTPEKLNQPLNIKRNYLKELKLYLRQIMKLSAQFVKRYLKQLGIINICVENRAGNNGIIHGVEIDIENNPSFNPNAYIAGRNTMPDRLSVKKIVEKPVLQNVPENGDIKEVFNLTVEPFGVYYANGILVSNCDTAYDAVRVAFIEKTVYSMTNQRASQQEKLDGLNEAVRQKIKVGVARNARSC